MKLQSTFPPILTYDSEAAIDFDMTNIWPDPRNQQGHVRDAIYSISRRTSVLISYRHSSPYRCLLLERVFMDLQDKSKSQSSQTWTTSSRVAPVRGVQETNTTFKRPCALRITRTRMGIKISVVIIQLPSLLLWAARLRLGLSHRRLWCVVRSSVSYTSLKYSPSRTRKRSGMHLCLRQWALSRSRPVRSLIRLTYLTYRSRSVFDVSPRATSTTLSRSLTGFAWNQGPLVDSKPLLP